MLRRREVYASGSCEMEVVESIADRLRLDIAACQKAQDEAGITALVAVEMAALKARYALVDKIIATSSRRRRRASPGLPLSC